MPKEGRHRQVTKQRRRHMVGTRGRRRISPSGSSRTGSRSQVLQPRPLPHLKSPSSLRTDLMRSILALCLPSNNSQKR